MRMLSFVWKKIKPVTVQCKGNPVIALDPRLYSHLSALDHKGRWERETLLMTICFSAVSVLSFIIRVFAVQEKFSFFVRFFSITALNLRLYSYLSVLDHKGGWERELCSQLFDSQLSFKFKTECGERGRWWESLRMYDCFLDSAWNQV